jgi:hypothetical protein
MMATPVAMPTRHRIGWSGIGSQCPDRRTQFEACADRLLRVVFVRLGVTEQDEPALTSLSSPRPRDLLNADAPVAPSAAASLRECVKSVSRAARICNRQTTLFTDRLPNADL